MEERARLTGRLAGALIDVAAMTPERRTILIGWDGSERARDALAFAGVLARVEGSHVHAVAVFKPRSAFAEHFGPAEKPRHDAEEKLEALPRELVEAMALSTAVVPGASRAEALHAEADTVGADVVVLGSTHRGALGRAFLGTVALDLLHESSRGVAVAPAGYASEGSARLERVLVAFDGSGESRAAMARGVSIARRAGAVVEVVVVADTTQYPWALPEGGMADPSLGYSSGVYPDPELVEIERHTAQRRAHELLDQVPSDGTCERRVVEGDPAEALVEASRGADLLLMGSRAQGTAERALVGSTSARVIRSAHCPVWVMPADAGGGARTPPAAKASAGGS
jgi:nucleotide-binding universal stress UspA family protein